MNHDHWYKLSVYFQLNPVFPAAVEFYQHFYPDWHNSLNNQDNFLPNLLLYLSNPLELHNFYIFPLNLQGLHIHFDHFDGEVQGMKQKGKMVHPSLVLLNNLKQNLSAGLPGNLQIQLYSYFHRKSGLQKDERYILKHLPLTNDLSSRLYILKEPDQYGG